MSGRTPTKRRVRIGALLALWHAAFVLIAAVPHRHATITLPLPTSAIERYQVAPTPHARTTSAACPLCQWQTVPCLPLASIPSLPLRTRTIYHAYAPLPVPATAARATHPDARGPPPHLAALDAA